MGLNDANAELLNAIAKVVGSTGLRQPGPDDLHEPRGLFRGRAAAVIRPANTAELSAVMKLCHAALVGVVPLGGGTGLTGGRTLEQGPIPVLLSLEKMSAIRSLDSAANTLVAEAGAILQNVQTAAAAQDRLFPLSLASQGSAQIGGVLSTNAGGVNVLRYGNARNLCLGLEVVLADGRIWHGLKGLHKDNTGYDLRDLMIGAEGTLGIITAAVLRLYPRPAQHCAAWIAVPDPATALELYTTLSAELGGTISAFELIDQTGLDFLRETGVMTPPADLPVSPWSVLLDCSAGPGSDLAERVELVLGRAFELDLCSDALISQNQAQRDVFWQIREAIPAANRRIGAVSSHDIALPLAAIPNFIAKARAAIDPQLRLNCFGHLGDGNLHFNFFPPKGAKRSDFAQNAPLVQRMVYDLVAEMGGSFSAEHGIGRLKLNELQRYSDPVKLQMMRAIKSALDPRGILNPGALIPPENLANTAPPDNRTP